LGGKLAVELPAGRIPDVGHRRSRTVRQHDPALRPPLVLHLLLQLPDPDALDEAQRHRKLRVELDVAALVVEVTSFALQCSECTESPYTGGVVQLARLAPHQLAGEGPVLAELQPAVEREHAGEAANQLAVGREEPDGRFFPY